MPTDIPSPGSSKYRIRLLSKSIQIYINIPIFGFSFVAFYYEEMTVNDVKENIQNRHICDLADNFKTRIESRL